MRASGRRASRLGVVVLGVAGLIVAWNATSAFAAPTSVSPIVVCSVTRNGATHSIFGYDNSGPELTIGIGSSNRISPGPADRGQPTTFPSGTKINVFAVDSSSRLTWTLAGVQVHTPGEPCQATPAGSTLAGWGPIAAIAGVTAMLGLLLFWRTRRLRVRS